jgi:heme/copper-type cytochrome/quinol oxidase subunit 3
MTTTTASSVERREPPRARKPVVPNGVLGMLLFIGTELMFFAGFISAFSIVKTRAPSGGWPPPGQPRLPILETAFNTGALLASGLVLLLAARAFKVEKRSARIPLLISIVLGSVFVVFQGVEWVALLKEGLTLVSSTHGSFFYTIVGVHALHVVVALGALLWAYGRLNKNRLDEGAFWTTRLLWYFVVGIWPVIYWRVYL